MRAFYIIRVVWVFGQYGNNFVKTMLRLACEHDELSVVDDQLGAPTPAAAIAEAALSAALSSNPHFGVHHLESNPQVSWHGFAQEIFKQAQIQGLTDRLPHVRAVTSDAFPTVTKRPAYSKLAAGEQALFAPVAWQPALTEMLKQLPLE